MLTENAKTNFINKLQKVDPEVLQFIEKFHDHSAESLLNSEAENGEDVQSEIFACCQFAVRMQNVSVFENLFREIKGNEKFGCRLLHEACDVGCTDIINICLRNNVPFNECHKILEVELPLLLQVVDKGHINVIKYLCSEADVDLKVTNKYGITAVMLAAKNESTACLDVLIKSGCDVTTRDNSGSIALHHLCYPLIRTNKAIACSKLLIKAGNDVNAENSHGDTPCQVAEVRQHYELVQAFITENCVLTPNEFRFIPCLATLCSGKAFSVVRRGSVYYFDGETWCYRQPLPQDNGSNDTSPAFKTLKDACRFEIRKCLGSKLNEKLDKLNLPTLIKDFILLKDIISPEYFVQS